MFESNEHVIAYKQHGNGVSGFPIIPVLKDSNVQLLLLFLDRGARRCVYSMQV